ncbi:hypothetical protein HK104_008656 [Borealophlyctis nickersoniae]|nr:hypothetical protein HK104_008656 [Borealophlyctis nickersoniae]
MSYESGGWVKAYKLVFTERSRTFDISLHSLKTLDPTLLDWALGLVKKNLHDQYVAAKDTGWSDTDKRREMTEPPARYLVVRERDAAAAGIGQDGNGGRLAGFCYFQLTLEDASDDDVVEDGSGSVEDVDGGEGKRRKQLPSEDQDGKNGQEGDGGSDGEGDDEEENEGEGDDEDYEDVNDQIAVMYCYELQLEPHARSIGLGTHLMRIAEAIGKRWGMRKGILTVFKCNVAAIGFYRKMGYDVDGISPSKHLPPRRAQRISYEILSKRL